MGKYNKRKAAQQRKILTVALAGLSALLILLVIVLVGLNRGNKPEEVVPGTTEAAATELISNMKLLQVESTKEQGENVIVATTYGTVKYPYAFSDLVIVEAETFMNHAALEFKAEIDGQEYKLYTLLFNGEEGMPVGKLLVDGETYVVTALFHDVTELSGDNLVTFYAVQETFNDVVNSLADNGGFTAED